MFYQSISIEKPCFICFSPAARVFYISLVFSNVRRVLSQCNARLRLLYLLNNTNMKKIARKKCRKPCFLKSFLRIRENFFQSFRTKFLSLLYMISSAYKISHFLSANHNPELRCVVFVLVLHLLHRCVTFSTGVTLELHCSQPIRMEYFFSCKCIIKQECSFFSIVQKYHVTSRLFVT